MNTSLLKGTVVAGKFVLTRPLATGGQGSIWIARDKDLGVEVAIKFLAGFQQDPELVERFHREAKAAAQIRSTNVVQVYEHGTFELTPYIVMELLKGEDLQSRLRRVARLDLRALAPILRGACKALKRAHAAGLVHRDLKPGNIFLVQEDGEEIVKVVDFGAAKVQAEGEHRLTKTGFFMGTPQYMSPEQIASFRDADHRADLWSIGVIAYRVLTGDLPFRGANLTQVLRRVCEEMPPPPSGLVPGLGPEVDAFFERALAKQPSERFQSAEELAEAFEKLVEAAPGAAPITGSSAAASAAPARRVAETQGTAQQRSARKGTGTVPMAPGEGATHPVAQRSPQQWPATSFNEEPVDDPPLERSTIVTRVILAVSLLAVAVAIVMILKGAGLLPG